MNVSIHPTAVVHPDAQIGEGTSIGAFSVVEANVTIGAGSKIQSHVVIQSHTHIGERAKIHPFVVLGGTLASAGDLMLDAIRTECTRRLRPAQSDAVRIVLSTLGDEAGAIAGEFGIGFAQQFGLYLFPFLPFVQQA